jgi:uncharacterized protein
LIGLIGHDFSQGWHIPRQKRSLFYQLLMYWSCWFLWPLAAWLCLEIKNQWRHAKFKTLVYTALLTVCSAIIWARFIEPSMLVVYERQLANTCGVRVALISDAHMGSFWRNHDLNRLVDKLNTLEVDAVLVAGDWTAEPPRNLTQVFAPLSRLRHPIYSVTGNHDEQHPGPPLTEDLLKALSSAGVQNIEAQRVKLGQCELVGLGDLRAGSASKHVKALANTPSAVPASQRIVLTHEPETAEVLPGEYAAWVLAGHTHGGQVGLPWITQRILRKYHFQQGVYKLPKTKLFVTSGVGMSGVPFRFRVPPAIDVLSL